MTLEKTDVEHVASLCNLSLSPQEVEKLAHALKDILDYIKVLEELDAKDVPATYQVTGLVNIFKRDEESKTTLGVEQATANAKEVLDNKFVTQAVFNREQ